MSLGKIRERAPGPSTWLRAAAVVVALGIPAILAYSLRQQYVHELANAEQLAVNMARSLEQHGARTLETIDTYLRAVASLTTPREEGLRLDTVHAALREQFLRSHHLNNLMVIDANGRSIIEAVEFPARLLDVHDRDYFQELRNGQHGGLVIGRPITGRLTGKLLLPVARRIDNPDGTFAGVVQAMLTPETFQSFYDRIDNGPGATLALWRADGTLLVRSPLRPELVGKSFAETQNYRLHVPFRDAKPFWAPSAVDGVERVIAFSYLDGYPLYVSASLGRTGALAAWRKAVVTQSTLAGGLTLVLVTALLWLAREVERRHSADAEIRTSEARYRLLAENTSDIIIWSDLETRRRYISPAVTPMLGYKPEDLIGTHPLDFIHPDDVRGYRRVLDGLTSGRVEQAVTVQRYRHQDGRWVWVEISFKLTRDATTGVADGYIASLRDVGQRKAAEEALRQSEERLALAVRSGNDGLWDWKGETQTLWFSGRLLSLFGYEPDEIEPSVRSWAGLLHPDDRERALRAFFDHLKGATDAYECEHRLRRRDGSYAWVLARGRVVSRDAEGRALRVIGTHMDITERKQAEERIAHIAMHDGLTGLPNRMLFRDRLGHALADARRRGAGFTLLACDLDQFKTINDTLGHPAGDALLKVVADRLRAATRENDTVARLGGDEFAVILSDVDDPQIARSTVTRVIAAMGPRIDLDGSSTSIGISIGVAFGPRDGEDADTLFKNADIALYRAKAAGRNTHSFYEPGMDAALAARINLEQDLREAIRQERLTLRYQPVVSIASEVVSGFEALLRWQHPTRGAVSPTEFIPLAEETGLIVTLGEWVLREACQAAAGWPGNMRVAVNVSAVQFQQPGLEQAVQSALVTSGLAPQRLELEITESVLMQDSEAVIACLHRLKALGVRIALDDFGTGFSSLSYLRRFPFDKIKIDRSFIRDIADPDTAAIVRAIVGIAARRGATVTAEGVETREQLEQVRQEGCTEVQGFFYSKPLAAAVAMDFARAQKGRKAA